MADIIALDFPNKVDPLFTRSFRPIYHFALGREWVACRGAEEIGPRRMFHWEAINDLPLEASVRPGKGSYSCHEPYGARPRFVDDTDLIGYHRSWRQFNG